MIKICPICKKEYQTRHSTQIHCSRKCSSKREITSEYRKKLSDSAKKLFLTKNCEYCKKEYIVRTMIDYKKRRFCSLSCASKWKMKQPDIREKIIHSITSEQRSKKMKEVHKNNPGLAKASSERMKKNNPSSRPEVKAKIKKYWQEHEHPIKKIQPLGGNGRQLSLPQRLLWATLGGDWEIEYVYPTKKKIGSGYPNHYKIDIALPKLKIWIEVDGWTHNVLEIQKKDKKKEDFLTERGWRGLRFKNERILSELPIVVEEINKFIQD